MQEDFEEIEKLATWYEYFQKSYQAFEEELNRRKQFQQHLADRVL